MFTVTAKNEKRVDIELSDDIDAEMMEAALDELLKHSENIKNGRMLYPVTDFHWPTLGAIGAELSRFPSLFGLAFKFKRAALATDEQWLEQSTLGES